MYADSARVCSSAGAKLMCWLSKLVIQSAGARKRRNEWPRQLLLVQSFLILSFPEIAICDPSFFFKKKNEITPTRRKAERILFLPSTFPTVNGDKASKIFGKAGSVRPGL